MDKRKKLEAEIARIEATQDALRESIEETKQLSAKAEELLQQHKKSLQAQSDD
jgi:ABC-type transporter Mla subunit MlaD